MTEIDTSEERERRIREDLEDARMTLNRARQRFDNLCEELREIRLARREQED